MATVPMDDHHDVVAEHHRFAGVTVGAENWQFEHLEAFAMRVPLELSPGKPIDIDIVVLFSNHCFTRGLNPGEIVDDALIVMDGSERRVLDNERYALSRQYLPRLILARRQDSCKNLPHRPNAIAASSYKLALPQA